MFAYNIKRNFDVYTRIVLVFDRLRRIGLDN